MYLGFSPMWLLGVAANLMFVNTLKCLKNISKQILAKVLLRAHSHYLQVKGEREDRTRTA